MPHTHILLLGLVLFACAFSFTLSQPLKQVSRIQVNSKLSLSHIGYGSLHWGEIESDEEFAKVLDTLISVGITTLDLSHIYMNGKSLDRLASTLQRYYPKYKDSFEYICKLDITSSRYGDFGFNWLTTTTEYVRETLDMYAQKINQTQLDLVLFHWPDFLQDPSNEELRSLLMNPRIKAFGVANFFEDTIQLFESYGWKIEANEIEASVFSPASFYDQTASMFKRRGVNIFWGSLGGNPAGGLKTNRIFDVPSEKASNLLKTADWIIQESGTIKQKVSREQLFLAWTLKHPSKVVPLIGTTRIDRILELSQAEQISKDLPNDMWYLLTQVGGLGIFGSYSGNQKPPTSPAFTLPSMRRSF